MERIRTATAADAAPMGAVHVDTWRTTYAGIVPDDVLAALRPEERAAMWTRAIGAGRNEILVAERDGQIVGFASGGAPRDALGFDAELHAIYVRRAVQGTGVGRALTLELAARLRARGHRSWYLWVLEANPATRFYERLGGRLLEASHDTTYGDRVLRSVAYGWTELP